MNNYVNNSLGDLMDAQNEWFFNDYKTKLSDVDKDIISLKNLIATLEIQERDLRGDFEQGNGVDESEVQAKQEELNNAKNKLNNIVNDSSTNIKNPNNSILDRYAIIDYGRVMANGNVAWNEYIKEGDKYIGNNKLSYNVPVPNQNQGDDDITIQNLVSWSEKFPALQLRFQDFAYCRYLGLYPNTKMIVLRKFKDGVPDNLFDLHLNRSYLIGTPQAEFLSPIRTLVTWMKPEDKFPTINFGDDWENGEYDIATTFNKVFSEFKGTSKETKKESKPLSLSMLDYAAIVGLLGLEKTDSTSDLEQQDLSGKPNLIKKSAKKKTDGSGINGSISIDLKFEYDMRYIQGLDPGIAMIDFISNCIKMGVSTSEFRMNYMFINPDKINEVLNGNFDKIYQNFTNNVNKVGDTIATYFTDLEKILADSTKLSPTEMSKKLNDFMNTLSNKSTNVVTSTLKFILSRYREDLKAAVAAETGSPSGVYHVTYGNPKIPIMGIGDLYPEDMGSIELGTELGYNGFPNSFTYNIKLKSARPRGAQEIQRIYNVRGRTYVYPKANQEPSLNRTLT
jgi:hypothetical protein